MRFVLFTFLVALIDYSTEWSIPLEFSVQGSDFIPLGDVNINSNGNQTAAEFRETNSALSILDNMLDKLPADVKLPNYKVRSGKYHLCSNIPRIQDSTPTHTIYLTIDQNTRSLLSVCHYPYVDREQKIAKVETRKPSIVLMVERVAELPSPDTATYLLRLEEEKRSRQHGATQDNRSFLAKYWYYIVPVVIFMVVSNAFNSDQTNSNE